MASAKPPAPVAKLSTISGLAPSTLVGTCVAMVGGTFVSKKYKQSSEISTRVKKVKHPLSTLT
jgi:hypothetical protein|tara:strand:+ start:291 stop:479 length:189 start_codon:yes stop_codon:yes gene_type:complete